MLRCGRPFPEGRATLREVCLQVTTHLTCPIQPNLLLHTSS
jgi:hypothetical protein